MKVHHTIISGPQRLVYGSLIFFVLGLMTSKAQDLWMRTFGSVANDYAYSVISSNDGRYLVGGTTASFGNGYQDYWLLKVDSNGDTLWSRTYGGTGSDDLWSSILTNTNQIVLCGASSSFGQGGLDFYLICLDSIGNVLWSNTYGGLSNDIPTTLIQTNDGGLVIAGYTESFGNGNADIWVLKTNSVGDSLWSRTIGGAGFDVARSILQLSSENLFIAGGTESFGSGESDIFLSMLSPTGDSLWAKTYGGLEDDVAFSSLELENGEILVSGYTYIPLENGWLKRAFLLKADNQGDTLFNRVYNSQYTSTAINKVIVSHDGGYVLAGYSHDFGAQDAFIMHTDDQGTELWSRSFGPGGSFDNIISIIVASDGGYLTIGYTEDSGNGGFDFWLVKTDSAGNSYYDPVATESIAYPLALGNEWHYRSTWEPDDYGFGIQDEIHRIVSDTLMPNGETYWKTEVIDLTGTSNPGSYYQRYAEEDGIVFRFEEGSCLNDEFEMFNLNYSELGAYSWSVCNDVSTQVNTYFELEGDQSYLQTNQDGLIHQVQEFVDGVGLRSTLTTELVTYFQRLEGWIIDGVESGTLLSTTNHELYPADFKLRDAYPNPFNPSTIIEYQLPESADVSLIIYDITGREVQTLVAQSQATGSYQAGWDGKDRAGKQVAGGMYVARLQAGGYARMVKMVYLR